MSIHHSCDVLTALRYDICEKLESCEPCKGVRDAALEALEEAVELIEKYASSQEVARQWDLTADGRPARAWLKKVRGFDVSHKTISSTPGKSGDGK